MLEDMTFSEVLNVFNKIHLCTFKDDPQAEDPVSLKVDDILLRLIILL